MSGVECHHRLWKARTVKQRWVWHYIIALLLHTHSRATSGVECKSSLGEHTRLDDIRHGMPRSGLTTHILERRQAWHAIISLRHRTLSDQVGRGMP